MPQKMTDKMANYIEWCKANIPQDVDELDIEFLAEGDRYKKSLHEDLQKFECAKSMDLPTIPVLIQSQYYNLSEVADYDPDAQTWRLKGGRETASLAHAPDSMFTLADIITADKKTLNDIYVPKIRVVEKIIAERAKSEEKEEAPEKKEHESSAIPPKKKKPSAAPPESLSPAYGGGALPVSEWDAECGGDEGTEDFLRGIRNLKNELKEEGRENNEDFSQVVGRKALEGLRKKMASEGPPRKTFFGDTRNSPPSGFKGAEEGNEEEHEGSAKKPSAAAPESSSLLHAKSLPVSEWDAECGGDVGNEDPFREQKAKDKIILEQFKNEIEAIKKPSNKRKFQKGESTRPMEDYRFRIALFGDEKVGKSCLSLRYADDWFQPLYDPTNLEFSSVSGMIEDAQVKIQLWDVGSKLSSGTMSHLRGTTGFIIAFDITRRKTFENIQSWVDEADELGNEELFCKILVGTKCDLSERREVSKEEAEAFARSLGISYFETSSRNNENVEEAFAFLIEQIYEEFSPTPEYYSRRDYRTHALSAGSEKRGENKQNLDMAQKMLIAIKKMNYVESINLAFLEIQPLFGDSKDKQWLKIAEEARTHAYECFKNEYVNLERSGLQREELSKFLSKGLSIEILNQRTPIDSPHFNFRFWDKKAKEEEKYTVPIREIRAKIDHFGTSCMKEIADSNPFRYRPE